MDKKPERLYAHEIVVMHKVTMHYWGQIQRRSETTWQGVYKSSGEVPDSTIKLKRQTFFYSHFCFVLFLRAEKFHHI